MKSVIFLIALALSVGLTACSILGDPPGQPTLTQAEQANLTPSARVYQLKGEFLGYLKLANRYKDQPPCTEEVVVACSDPDVVEAMQDAAVSAREALDAAEIAVRANESPEEAIGAAREGLAVLSRHLMRSMR